MIFIKILLLKTIFIIHFTYGKILFLNGKDWKLSDSEGFLVSATVPGNVYKDLQKCSVIGEPLYRFNDYQYKWVGLKNWTYTKKFNVSRKVISYDVITLIMEGVDTVAEVILNDVRVGQTDNMFVKYQFSIRGALKPGLNEIKVSFVSPVLWAKNRALEYAYTVPPSCPPPVQNGSCHFNFIRKASYSFSWDWGPNFPGVGIWKSVYIQSHNELSLNYLNYELQLEKSGRQWLMTWQVRMKVYTDVRVILMVRQTQLNLTHNQSFRLTPGNQTITSHITFKASDVMLWWPNGMGQANLYKFSVVMKFDVSKKKGTHGKEKNEKDKIFYDKQLIKDDILWERNVSVGFRRVDLVQDYVETKGLTFYFKFNDKPLFIKGSNWIPISNFLSTVDEDDGNDNDNDENVINSKKKYKHNDNAYDDNKDVDKAEERFINDRDGNNDDRGDKDTKKKIDWLLKSAVDVHMNMLRVWGGGVYEFDYFYQRADELGLMVWQDFMFACALYPSDPAFLKSVEQEVSHQVLRLKNHPSIVLWAGNNENEGALTNNWFNISKEDYPGYKRDYLALYVNLMREVVRKNDNSRIFLTSSPSNGLQTEVEGWLAQDPQSNLFGDVHFYDYSHDLWLSQNFPIPRFASEFGVQSWPSLESLIPVSNHGGCKDCEDLKLMSEFVQHRQHHQNGEEEMMSAILKHFIFPFQSNKTQEFIDYIYLGQINQAMSIKSQVEHYRRNSGIDEGFTMGSLYWQLNDVWQAPSWSSIEYSGQWKMLHYYAKHFYDPYLISCYFQRNTGNDKKKNNTNNIKISNEKGNKAKSKSSSSDNKNDYDLKDMFMVFFTRDDAYHDDREDGDMKLTLNISCVSYDGVSSESWNVSFGETKFLSPSTLVYKTRLSELAKKCHCSYRNLKEHILFLKVFDEYGCLKSTNFQFLSQRILPPLIKKPSVKVLAVDIVSRRIVNITLKCPSVCLFVWLEAPLHLGTFTDNVFMMTSTPLKVSFQARHPIRDLKLFKEHLKVRSLSDVYNEEIVT